MNYASIKKNDVANGPGIRVSLFVSGCTHYCKECFNKEAWDYNYGQPFTDQTIEEIIESLKPSYIRGLTLLGGEPLDPKNQEGIVKLLRVVRNVYPEKPIWCFTGYLFDQDVVGKMLDKEPYTREILSNIDIVVDGKFVEELKDLGLRFKGSSNQRTIDVKASLDKGEVVLVEGY